MEGNAIVEQRKREARAEQRISAAVASKKKYSKRALALMTLGRGALIVGNGSRGA